MRAFKFYVTLFLTAFLLVGTSCTNDSSLDAGDSANVVLEVEALLNPAVTCVLNPAGALFTVEEWQFTAKNLPKNSLAEGSSPFNDILLISVTVQYNWIDGAFTTPTRTIGLGSIVVPVDGSGNVTFLPIAFTDIQAAMAGNDADLTMTFNARTVEGTTITDTVFRRLTFEGCTIGG